MRNLLTLIVCILGLWGCSEATSPDIEQVDHPPISEDDWLNRLSEA